MTSLVTSRLKRTLILTSYVILVVVGIATFLTLLFCSEMLRQNAPKILAWSGSSPYHIEHYWSEAAFYRCRQLGFLTSAGLILLGAFLCATQPRWISLGLTVSRRVYILIKRCDGHTRKSSKLDSCLGYGLIVVAGTILVLGIFKLPIRGDEVAMYHSVCSSTLPLGAVAYISPNNHVGYASLVWVGHCVWSYSVPGMRCFSLLSWLMSLVILTQIHIHVFGRRAVSLIALAAVPPIVMTMGVLSRGFSLGALLVYASMLMVLRSRDSKDAVIAGIAGGGALWVVPSTLYGIVVIVGVLVWQHRENHRRAIGMTIAYAGTAVCFAMFLYSPIVVVSGLDTLLAHKGYPSRDFHEVLASHPVWVKDVLMVFFGSGGAIGMLYLLCGQRVLVKPELHLVVLALVPVLALALPILHLAFPPARALAFLVPLIVVFWGGSRSVRMHQVYGCAALAMTVFLLSECWAVLDNEESGKSHPNWQGELLPPDVRDS